MQTFQLVCRYLMNLNRQFYYSQMKKETLIAILGVVFVIGLLGNNMNGQQSRQQKGSQVLSAKTCHQTEYSFSTFALTWIGQYCYSNTCSSNWQELWDGKTFTIHGYWPNSVDLAFLKCQSQNTKNGGYDPYCYYNYDFNEYALQDLRDQMTRVWPQIGAIKQFWAYEFKKHGTCYMKLALDQFPYQMTEEQIYMRYFTGILSKYQNLILSGVNKSMYASRDELAAQIGVQSEALITICTGNYLREIRICYNLDRPGSEIPIPCPSRPSECSFPIYLRGK